MRARIKTEIARLAHLLTEAEEKQNSDNEATTERYEEVADALQAALDALEEAAAAVDH